MFPSYRGRRAGDIAQIRDEVVLFVDNSTASDTSNITILIRDMHFDRLFLHSRIAALGPEDERVTSIWAQEGWLVSEHRRQDDVFISRRSLYSTIIFLVFGGDIVGAHERKSLKYVPALGESDPVLKAGDDEEKEEVWEVERAWLRKRELS